MPCHHGLSVYGLVRIGRIGPGCCLAGSTLSFTKYYIILQSYYIIMIMTSSWSWNIMNEITCDVDVEGPRVSHGEPRETRLRQVCVICMENLANLVVMPCKHLAICSPQPQWPSEMQPIGNCNAAMEGVTLWILRFCGLGDLVECPICRSQQVVPGGLWDVSVLALSLALPYPNFSQLVLPCRPSR